MSIVECPSVRDYCIPGGQVWSAPQRRQHKSCRVMNRCTALSAQLLASELPEARSLLVGFLWVLPTRTSVGGLYRSYWFLLVDISSLIKLDCCVPLSSEFEPTQLDLCGIDAVPAAGYIL